LSFPLRAEDNNFLPRLWATRRVGWLIEQIRANGENKELRDEIVELGTRYGIVTPYTSYLATDGSDRDDRRPVPVPMRAAPGVIAADKAANQVMRAQSGAEAVQTSKDAKAKREAEKISKETSAGVQNVGTKTFYLDENGVWIDAEFKAESRLPEIKLAFASKEFFDLIAREKELARFFSLGEQVVVVWKGKVYRVTK
jgi:Ca-activated chloride channel family protein